MSKESRFLGVEITRREWIRRSFLASVGLGVLPLASSCSRHLPPLEPGSILRPEADRALLLCGAGLLDVRGGRRIPGMSVLVQGSRITAVEEDARMSVPPEAVRIDLGGKTLSPAFINAHCHLALPGSAGMKLGYFRDYKMQLEMNCLEAVRRGVTTVRDMSGPHGRIEELREAIDQGRLLGPRIQTPARSIRKAGGYPEFNVLLRSTLRSIIRTIDGPKEAREAVREAVGLGADFAKTFHQRRPLLLDRDPHEVPTTGELDAMCNEADRFGRGVALHITDVEGFRKALDTGVRTFEHMAHDGPLTERDVQRFVDAGRYVIPTASVAWALAFRIKGDDNGSDPMVIEMVRDRDARIESILKELCVPSHYKGSMWLYNRLADPTTCEKNHLLPVSDPTFFTSSAVMGTRNLRALYDGGALFGLGNDGGVPLLFPGLVGIEMVILERFGLRAADILRMATLNNAALMGLEADLGTIEPGKLADMVVLDGDPVESIRAVLDVEAVFKEGTLVHSAGAVRI